MRMYRSKKCKRGSLRVNNSYEAETLERKIERMLENGEPIGSGVDQAELIFQDRKDGIQPAYDVRTDRFELAVETMDKVNKSKTAKSDAKIKKLNNDDNQNNNSDDANNSNG